MAGYEAKDDGLRGLGVDIEGLPEDLAEATKRIAGRLIEIRQELPSLQPGEYLPTHIGVKGNPSASRLLEDGLVDRMQHLVNTYTLLSRRTFRVESGALHSKSAPDNMSLMFLVIRES